MKECKTCKIKKEESNFYFSTNKHNGKKYASSSCKMCDNQRSRAYHLDNKDKRHRQHKDWRTLAKYGISPEKRDNILKSQNYACAICGKSDEISLAIDHDHATGIVRGMLCNNCNNGLGRFMDNVELLKNAILYLEK